ncbi:MAG: DUF4129 domain-containing protein [bacterium]|nr:DUF4129 domain-containing protein [bacterium]
MSVWLVKLLTDVCWYFAIAGAILPFLPSVLSRILNLGVPLAYTLYLLWKARGGERLLFQKEVFLWQCRILGGMTALELVFLEPALWEQSATRWLLLFLVFGVALLRMTRLGEEYRTDRHFLSWNIGGLLLLLVAGAICTSNAAVQSFVWLLRFLYFRLCYPLLLALLYGIFWLLEGIFSLLDALVFSHFHFEVGLAGGSEFAQNALEQAWKGPETTEFPLPFRTFLYFLGAIALCLLLYAIYRRLLADSGKAEDFNRSSIKKSHILIEERQTKKRKRDEEEEEIRLLYQRFLRLYEQCGLRQKKNETSEEIAAQAGSHWNEAELEEFRKMYLKVRYGEKTLPSQDTARAKKLLKKWKTEKT